MSTGWRIAGGVGWVGGGGGGRPMSTRYPSPYFLGTAPERKSPVALAGPIRTGLRTVPTESSLRERGAGLGLWS